MPESILPSNTEKDLYIPTYGGDVSLQEVIDMPIKPFCKDVNINDLTINAEYIRTECIHHDLFDSSDWTNFLHVSLK